MKGTARWLGILGVFGVAVIAFSAGLIVSARLDTGSTGMTHPVTPATRAVDADRPPNDDDIVLTQGLFRHLVQSTNPGVVNISTAEYVEGRDWWDRMFRDMPDWFRFYFRPPEEEERRRPQYSLGSGFIIDPDGYILTNYHVVQKADDITVILHNGHRYTAEIVGTDKRTDVALLRIRPDEDLTALPLGDSDRVQVGDWVIAIGNPFGFSNSVTTGIISGRGGLRRRIQYVDYLQTDAPINPGNSGGPLINLRGEVIGINTWIWSNTYQWGGLGFATPINPVKRILPDLREKGYVERGYLGVNIQVSEDVDRVLKSLGAPYGAPVLEVQKGTPADKAGLKRYDVIMEVNGKKISEPSELPDIISSYPPGTEVTLKIWRDGKTFDVKVRLERFPEEAEPQPRPRRRRETLGMVLEPIPPEFMRRHDIPGPGGLMVRRVDLRSPAQRAGIRRGDVILEADRHPVRTVEEFVRIVEDARAKGQDTILLLIWRQGATALIPVEIPKAE